MRAAICCVASAIMAAGLIAVAQERPDAALLQEILQIPAIDNHTHVPRVDLPGEKDEEFDALPCDPLEPSATNFLSSHEFMLVRSIGCLSGKISSNCGHM